MTISQDQFNQVLQKISDLRGQALEIDGFQQNLDQRLVAALLNQAQVNQQQTQVIQALAARVQALEAWAANPAQPVPGGP